MSEVRSSGFTQPVMGTGPAPRRSGLLASRELVEVRFAGAGEQGVLLMGVVLAMSATRDHRYVVQTQTYGLGTRGGYGHSDVIVSDHPIDYPELEAVDLLVTLCQESTDGYADMLRPDGILLYESDNVTRPPSFSGPSFGIPFGRLAYEVAGDPETAVEVVTLGAVAAITGVVSADSLQKAVLSMVGAGEGEINSKALARGLAVDPAEWRKEVT